MSVRFYLAVVNYYEYLKGVWVLHNVAEHEVKNKQMLRRKDLNFIFWILYMSEEFLQIVSTGSHEHELMSGLFPLRIASLHTIVVE